MPNDPRFPRQRPYMGPQAQPQPQYPPPQQLPVPQQLWEGYPQPQQPDAAQMYRGAQGVVLGAAAPRRLRDDPAYDNFQKVPAYYTITIVLGGEAGDPKAGSTPLRPEAFIAERITWACNESPLDYMGGTALGGSPQGRAVRVTWGDEFTSFLGKQPVFLSALYGDSDGFLDLGRGILFQGKQTLNAALTRISDPTKGDAPELEFDINFQGIGLLPPDVAQSGSAG